LSVRETALFTKLNKARQTHRNKCLPRSEARVVLANCCFLQMCWPTAASYRLVGQQLLLTDLLANSCFLQTCWPTVASHGYVGQQLIPTDVLANS